MNTTNPSIALSLPAIKESSIPDVYFDGSKAPSTFWLSVLAPVLMLATLMAPLLSTFMPMVVASNALFIAGALSTLALGLLIAKFPTSASQRFITTNFRRPLHFIPTAIGFAVASSAALLSAAQIDVAGSIALSANTAGNLAALFAALSIATGSRYAMNFVAMTERLIVLLLCWGGSAMVQDNTLLAIGVVGLSLNVLWSIQSRWTPMAKTEVVKPTM